MVCLAQTGGRDVTISSVKMSGMLNLVTVRTDKGIRRMSTRAVLFGAEQTHTVTRHAPARGGDLQQIAELGEEWVTEYLATHVHGGYDFIAVIVLAYEFGTGFVFPDIDAFGLDAGLFQFTKEGCAIATAWASVHHGGCHDYLCFIGLAGCVEAHAGKTQATGVTGLVQGRPAAIWLASTSMG